MSEYRLLNPRLMLLSLLCGNILFAAPSGVLAELPGQPGNSQNPVQSLQIFPAFNLPGFDGTSFDSSVLKGKVTYIDFWASWCPPCVVSLPWLDSLAAKYKPHGLQVIGINLDEVRSSAEKFINRFELQFPILWDPRGSLASKLALPAMPTSYLIDQSGQIILRHSGFRSSDKQKIEDAITEALQRISAKQGGFA